MCKAHVTQSHLKNLIQAVSIALFLGKQSLSSLTSHQQQVVAHNQGHARVVAVAGAGKTTTLTHFIGARLAEGVSSRRMLVLMYNVSARKDFEKKLQKLLPHQALPQVRTFHSLGLKIYNSLIGQGHLPAYEGKPLSNGEMEPIIWRMLQHLADADTRQDILSQKKKWVEPALTFIELVKADSLPPEVIFESLDLPAKCKIFVPLFYEFEQWRKANRRISYDDMLYEPVQVFLKNHQVAEQFGGHMQWILVDEYQDINAIQQKLLDYLHAGRGSVMVIGDPDQTIYEFRGSKPEFIVSEFDQKMQQVTVYTLPHTFRYGNGLSLLANHLISHNKEREEILCLSHLSTPNTQVHYHPVQQESRAILELIKKESLQRPYDQIAVINRIWALCAPIELALLQAAIPYQMYGSLSVLDRNELKVFWILFEIAAGIFDRHNEQVRRDLWLRYLTTPYPKIKHDVLVQIAMQMATVSHDYGAALEQLIPDNLSKWQKEKLETKANILSDAEHIKTSAYRIVENFIEYTDLFDDIVDNSFSAQQADDQIQTIAAFASFIKESQQPSNSVYYFLKELKQKNKNQQRGKGVHLISVHKSKGLEWPVVIVPGLNAHYYPYSPEIEFSVPASEESERRLLYVAMTRAMQQLHLFAPARNNTPESFKIPRECLSRFDTELQVDSCIKLAEALADQKTEVTLDDYAAPWLSDYLEKINSTLTIKVQQTKQTRPLVGKNDGASKAVGRTSDNRKGRIIEHVALGKGEVVSEDDKQLKVRFVGEHRTRTLDKKTVAQFLK